MRAAADGRLLELLGSEDVVTHPFVIGEIALGHVRDRDAVLASLHKLPRSQTCADLEVLQFIHLNKLVGSGVGYIDAHLLASTKLTDGCALWTLDRRLQTVALRLGLSADRP